jgi:hypothetical protein
MGAAAEESAIASAYEQIEDAVSAQVSVEEPLAA